MVITRLDKNILSEMGFSENSIEIRLLNGYGFAIIENKPIAAFGFIYNDWDIEVWFEIIETNNLFALRSLKRAFISAINHIPNYITLVTHKNQNLPKVAFEKLALSCGFKLIGEVRYPEGTFITAKRFGGLL